MDNELEPSNHPDWDNLSKEQQDFLKTYLPLVSKYLGSLQNLFSIQELAFMEAIDKLDSHLTAADVSKFTPFETGVAIRLAQCYLSHMRWIKLFHNDPSLAIPEPPFVQYITSPRENPPCP